MSAPARPTLPAPFDVLMNAGAVSLGPVGYAAVVPPEAIAYEQVRALGAPALAELERLLAHGTPAGRMYAAMLLGPIDRERSRLAWESLRSVHEWVTVAPGGCAMYRALVSDFAESVLTRGELMAYRASPQPERTDPAPPPAAEPPPSRLDRLLLGLSDLVGSVEHVWTRLQSSPGGAALIAIVSVSTFIGGFYLLSALLAAK